MARKHTPQIVGTIRALAAEMNDRQIVSHLNGSDVKTPEGRDFTVAAIQWIRYRHNIPPFTPARSGLTVKETVEKFGVGVATVYYL
jgi:hypothetical protein